ITSIAPCTSGAVLAIDWVESPPAEARLATFDLASGTLGDPLPLGVSLQPSGVAVSPEERYVAVSFARQRENRRVGALVLLERAGARLVRCEWQPRPSMPVNAVTFTSGGLLVAGMGYDTD